MTSNAIDLALRLLATWALAATVALIVIALLRPLVCKLSGARAVLRLWWIVPVALAITALPAEVRINVVAPHESTSLLDEGPLVITAPSSETTGAARVDHDGNISESTHFAPNQRWHEPELLVILWFLGAASMGLLYVRAQRRYSRNISWQPNGRGYLPANSVPAVVGFLSPRVVLPVDFSNRYSRAEQRLIRLHEAVHQQRRDGLINLCFAALRVLLWFHPLVHWAAHALGNDQEAACDETVISRHPDQAHTYAAALLRSATLPVAAVLPLVSPWQSHHPTVERIAMLKQHKSDRGGRFFARVALMVGAALSAALVHAVQPTNDVWLAAPRMSPLESRGAVHPFAAALVEVPTIITRLETATLAATGSEADRVARPPVSDKGHMPASGGLAAERHYYLGIEVTHNGKLIASPSLVTAEARRAEVSMGVAGGWVLRGRFTPRADTGGKISLSIELLSQSGTPVNTEQPSMSEAEGGGASRHIASRSEGPLISVMPGEWAAVSDPEEKSGELLWRIRAHPVPLFAATNGQTGTEVSAMSAFACNDGRQNLLPRLMRTLGDDVQISMVYRDEDSRMLRLVGQATNNTRVSRLLQEIGRTPGFSKANLLEVRQKELARIQFQIELALNCAIFDGAPAATTRTGAGAATPSTSIGVNMRDVKLSTLISVLGRAAGRRLHGVEALPAVKLNLDAMPVDATQALNALLGCAGHQQVEEFGEWWVRRDATRTPESDLNACAERNVIRTGPAATRVARTWPASLTSRFNVVLHIEVGQGLQSRYEKSVAVGEVMRLPLALDAELVCTLLNVADRLHLRCTENQDGLPLPTRHALMKRIDSDAPQQVEWVTRRGNFPGTVTIKEKVNTVRAS